MNQFRYTDQELSLISNTFSGENGEKLLKTIRKFFLQGELLTGERVEIEKIGSNEELMSLLKKCLLPEIDYEAPLAQLVDLWFNIDTKNQGPDRTYYDMRAREIAISYLSQQFEVLDGKPMSDERIKFADLVFNKKKKPEQAFIEMQARNWLLSFIDFHLNELRTIAGQQPESPEQIKKRLRQDSNK
jgi:hypothetical protein